MISKVASQEELKEINVRDFINNVNNFYDKTGKPCVENKAVAKTVEILADDGKTTNNCYLIKHGRGQLFDPYGMDMNKTNAFDFKFVKVDKNIYDEYMKYLKTRREVHLTNSRRLYISKGY